MLEIIIMYCLFVKQLLIFGTLILFKRKRIELLRLKNGHEKFRRFKCHTKRNSVFFLGFCFTFVRFFLEMNFLFGRFFHSSFFILSNSIDGMKKLNLIVILNIEYWEIPMTLNWLRCQNSVFFKPSQPI